MLVKPPGITAIEKTENPQGIINKPLIRNDIIENNDAIALNELTSKSPISTIETKEIVIKKKHQYRAFLKLIKAKKYTTAVLSARIIGVDNHTITNWLQTKRVRTLLDETYTKYINDIEMSKDWKAKAYLIDKLEGIDKTKEDNHDIKQMIVINT